MDMGRDMGIADFSPADYLKGMIFVGIKNRFFHDNLQVFFLYLSIACTVIRIAGIFAAVKVIRSDFIIKK